MESVLSASDLHNTGLGPGSSGQAELRPPMMVLVKISELQNKTERHECATDGCGEGK